MLAKTEVINVTKIIEVERNDYYRYNIQICKIKVNLR